MHTVTTEKGSTVARLQQCVLMSQLLLTGMAWVMVGGHSVVLAGVISLGVWLGYTVVLAVEFALLYCHQTKGESAPGPALLRAWCQEVKVDARVFGWRQPFLWRRCPDTLQEDGVKSGSKQQTNVVVFVHGLFCNRGFWHPWMRTFRRHGIRYVSMNLEPVWAEIDAYVEQLEAAVQKVEAATQSKPTLMCHSMGGLVARAWLVAATHNGRRVRQVTTIATPHHGTWLARFSHTRNGKQMRIGSDWLETLRRKEREILKGGEEQVSFTCWYSDADNIVFPASMATMPQADNRCIPGVAHVALAFHPEVMQETLDMLGDDHNSAKPAANRTAGDKSRTQALL